MMARSYINKTDLNSKEKVEPSHIQTALWDLFADI